MSEKHLEIEEFFARLSNLFNARRTSDHGSIYLTQKRLTPYITSKPAISPSPPTTSSEASAPFPDLNPSQPLPLIIRATNGKSKPHRQQGEKVKLSTIVQPDQLDNFFVRYAEVMKGGMSSLKKRDRSGRKKKKDKEAKK